MHGRACKQYIFQSYNTSTFNAMRFDKKSFHMPVRKRKQKGLRVSNFALLLVVFSSDIIAVKGLRALLLLAYILLHPPPFISTPHPPTATPQLPTQSNQQLHRRWKLPQHPYRQLTTCSVAYHPPVSQRRPVDKCFFLPRRTGSDFSRLSPCKGCPRAVVSGPSKDHMEGLTKKGFRARRL